MRQLLVIDFVLPLKCRKSILTNFTYISGFLLVSLIVSVGIIAVYILKVSTISTACLYVLKPGYTCFMHLDSGLKANNSMTYNYAVDALKSVYTSPVILV